MKKLHTPWQLVPMLCAFVVAAVGYGALTVWQIVNHVHWTICVTCGLTDMLFFACVAMQVDRIRMAVNRRRWLETLR